MILVPVLGFSLPAYSASNAELTERIRLLEAQLNELKSLVVQQGQAQQQQVVEQKKISERINSSPLLTEGTTMDFGGFIKADAMWTEFSDAKRAGSVADDFLVPSLIAVGNGDNGGDAYFDAHAKHSRLWFKTQTNTSAGAVTSYLEMDFNSTEGNERITNQNASGLRHAFLNWDYSTTGSLLAGQTWSTFFNVGALPEAVDFIGPTSGTLFNRQLQVRWTKKTAAGGSFMLAAENPSVGFYDGGGGVDGNNLDDSTMPDLVARYNGKAGNFDYSAAAIVREIAYDNLNRDDSDTGFALSLSGKYAFDNGDDIKFMLSHGNLGRYIALNAFRDGVVEADGSIDLIDVTGGFVAYRHWWSEKVRSTFSYAMSTADNPDSALADLTETVSNSSVNLLYSPTKSLTLGAEFIYADREVESGLEGDMTRLQFMGKLAF